MSPGLIALAAAPVVYWLFAKSGSASAATPTAGKSPAQRMAEVIATGDVSAIRLEAARLRAEGFSGEAAELDRVAVIIASETGQPVVAPAPSSAPAAVAKWTGPGLPAQLKGKTLKRGTAKTTENALLQQRLISLGFPLSTGADGVYGAQTEAAVKAFQSLNGLAPVDGIAGSKTLAKLAESTAKGPGAVAAPAPAPAAKPPLTPPLPPVTIVTPKPPAPVAAAKPPAAAVAPAPTGLAALKGKTFKAGSPAGKDAGVLLIQQRLAQLGHALSKLDGIFGAETTAAVKLFQKNNGLTSDGVVGAGTLAKLQDPTAKGPAAAAAPKPAPAPTTTTLPAGPAPAAGRAPTITATLKNLTTVLKNGKATGYKAPSSSGQAVTDWQNVLRELGFLASKPDGKFGDGTEQATRAFQAAANTAAKKSGKPALTVDGIVGPASIKRAGEARIMATGPATFTGDLFAGFGDDQRGMIFAPPEPLPDSPLPGFVPEMAPTPPDPRRALAARLAHNLITAPRGGEDRTLVARFQLQEALKPTGFYGPATALALAQRYGIVPPKPLYWTESRTSRSKANYRDALRALGERDPQRIEEWQRAGAV